MRTYFHPIVFVLERMQRRFARSRPGSVLILTVVLVVLLALLGTALLSTTRNDRYMSTQHTTNTEIDMLVEGVKEMAKSKIRSALFGANAAYRPPTDPDVGVASGAGVVIYRHYDSPELSSGKGSDWLSPRTPTMSVAGGTPKAIYWSSLGVWLSGDSYQTPLTFDGAAISSKAVDTQYIDRLADNQFKTAVSYVQLPGYGDVFPAWCFIPTRPGGSPMTSRRFVLAGDADGDGIADSSFFKLPVGEIDGVTYFAAVRIIDNNSAVNVNTAWSSVYDFNANPVASATDNVTDAMGTSMAGSGSFAANLGWFRSHVGLREMLRRNTANQHTPYATPSDWANDVNAQREINEMNRYRFGYTASAGTTNYVAQLTPLVTDAQGTTVGAGTRSDASFITQGDAMENQLARRLRNPGLNWINNGTASYRTFSASDAASLAYHFTLLNPDASPSLLESLTYGINPPPQFDSLYTSTANYSGAGTGTTNYSIPGRRSYTASQIGTWFDDNFNWDATASGSLVPISGYGSGKQLDHRGGTDSYRSIRSQLTTSNPVANYIQQRPLHQDSSFKVASATLSLSSMKDYTPPNPVKTNINTAPFEELWRAFWCVMNVPGLGKTGSTDANEKFGQNDVASQADLYRGMHFIDDQTSATAFAPVAPPIDPHKMFRSSIRDPRSAGAVTPAYFKPEHQVLLRSAIAAVQAEQMRLLGSAAPPQIVHSIQLPAGAGGGTYNVTIYGAQKQPFLTEVLFSSQFTDLNNPANQNAQGYVAIELYNPYAEDVVLDNTYDIVAVSKLAAGNYPLVAPVPIYQFANVTIPANGYIVLDNFGTFSGGATFRPASAVFAPGVTPIAAPLQAAYGQEMVIRKHIGTATDLSNFIPIDSFDFTNIVSVANTTVVDELHYARAAGSTNGNRWRCVYPGRYDATETGLRQQGIDRTQWDTSTPAAADPWGTGTITEGTSTRAPITLGNDNPYSSWNWSQGLGAPIIQLSDPATNWPSPNPLTGGANKFPFGQFARNGDILQVPFIGAYVIEDTNGGLIEMNSIAMDAAFAEDSDTNNDATMNDTPALFRAREQIGRFAPIFDTVNNRDDFAEPGNYDLDDTATLNKYSYRWVRQLFDYLTVHAPQDDYLPNVSPTRYPAAAPQPVDNDGDGTANDGTPTGNAAATNAENAIPVEGLININTVSWRVLAALPMLPPGDHLTYTPATNVTTPPTWAGGANGIDDNVELAKAIVLWRDGDAFDAGGVNRAPHGPFTSIYDLYKCPAFVAAQQQMLTAANPGVAEGDFTPNTPGAPDEARLDFEEQYLLLNRISNLISVRSDSYTVYVLVQGWRGIGTNKPQLVVQRRAAFIQDRSPVSDQNRTLPAGVNVPND